MSFERRRGRKVFDFDRSWQTLMTALAPDIWYDFVEASGTLTNKGSSGTDHDLTAQLPSTYGTFGPAGVSAADPTSIPLSGVLADSPYSGGTSAGLQDLNSGSPAATGTIVYVFRVEWFEGKADRRVILNSCSDNTFDGDALELRLIGDQMQFVMKNGSAAANAYTLAYLDATLEAASSSVVDGNWHMVAVVQNTTKPQVYYDGTLLVADSEVTGASITAAFWADDLNDTASADRIQFGGSITTTGNVSQVTAQGHADEWAYWDGVELSAATISQLWSSISANAALGNREARESILYAMREMEGGTLPSHVIMPTHPSDITGAQVDMGSASTPIGNLDDNGSGTNHGVLGGKADSRAAEFDPSSHIGGEILQGATASADFYSDTSGWVGFLFKIDDIGTFSTRPLHIGNNSATLDDGEVHLNITGTGINIPRIQWNWENGSPDDKVFFFQLQNAGAGDADIEDGNYHLLLINQPADGSGVTFYLDGVEYDPDHALNVEGTGTGYDSDVWFADASVDLTGTRVLDIGAQDLSGTRFAGIDGGVALVVIGGSQLDSTKVARMFAATGLPAP
jgi:hypothetical protein